MENIETLVIGCGNIGALYDLQSNEILTHAKAYASNSSYGLTVFDNDFERAEYIGKIHRCSIIFDINDISKFKLISICTPTFTHFELLKKALVNKTPVIICEKPISNNHKELDYLKEYYSIVSSKVIVNYFRRFHPSFKSLKNKIRELESKDKILNITIKYQKGFLNNCSHAIDLIEYLLGKNINFHDFVISNLVYDFFSDDPTLSALGTSENICYSIVGLPNINYSFFEVEIFFERNAIRIIDSGNKIEFYKSKYNKLFFEPLKFDFENSLENCMKDRMKFVIESATEMLLNDQEDNFLTSIDLNLRMLNVLKK